MVLEPYTQCTAGWIDAGLQLSLIHELLNPELVVSYSSPRRFVARNRLVPRSLRTTVRVAPSALGEIAEMDFGRLGALVHAETGARQTIWAMAVVLPFSRCAFVCPVLHQTLEEVIVGLERPRTLPQFDAASVGGVTWRLRVAPAATSAKAQLSTLALLRIGRRVDDGRIDERPARPAADVNHASLVREPVR